MNSDLRTRQRVNELIKQDKEHLFLQHKKKIFKNLKILIKMRRFLEGGRVTAHH